MSGVKWFYVSKEGKIFNIPQPKDWIFKPIAELANQSVLEVVLYYETRDRKPWRLISVSFDRINLDEKGQYNFTDDESNLKFRNFLEYGFTTVEELSQRPDPWAIPDAPVLPNRIEKETLLQFLKDKYPMLSINCSEIIEREVRRRQSIHQKNLELIKNAAELRKLKNHR